MSGLDDIAVTVVQGDADTAPTGQSEAILREVQDMLEALVKRGETNSIDLRSLPLFPGDYERIQAALGEGEVSATITALGPTTVRETAIPGVWWTIHRNAADEVMTELIEVTLCPEILRTQAEDAGEGLERLRKQLAEPESEY